MANGFRALRHVGGGVQRLSELPIDPTTAAIFNGDMVTIASGMLEKAATADTLAGTFKGCQYVNAKGEQKFSADWPADTAATKIYGVFNEDTAMTYKVDGDVAAVAGDTGDIVPGSGNASNGLSTSTVKFTTPTNDEVVVVSVLDAVNFVYEVKIV